MKRNPTPILIAIAATGLIVLILAFKSMFVVRTDQFAIVTEFGKPIEDVVDPGLYFKIPFAHSVIYVDKKIHGWEDTERGTKTNDGRQVDYTVYGRWKIVEPRRFVETLRGDEKQAHGAMDKLVKESIQKAVRSSPLAAIVHETRRVFTKREGVDLEDIYKRFPNCKPNASAIPVAPANSTTKAPLDAEDKPTHRVRSEVLRDIRDSINETLRSKNGIELLDLHFKYLNYSQQVQSSIITEIMLERGLDRKTYERVGTACVGAILRETEEVRGKILADAKERVRAIEGQGIAESIMIKSKAYNQNMDFYVFIQKLDLLKRSMKGRTQLVLSADSPILELLKNETILKGDEL